MTWEPWLRLDLLSSNAAHRMNRYRLAEVKKHYRQHGGMGSEVSTHPTVGALRR